MNKVRFIIRNNFNYVEVMNRILFKKRNLPKLMLLNCKSKIKNKIYFQRILKSSSFLLPILKFFGLQKEEDETPEHLMGLAIIFIGNNELEKALDLLHRILEILADKFENNEITKIEYEGKRARIFSEMGNVYILLRELDTASKLLIETMRSCIQSDIQPSNPIMIELSLKLALIYEDQGKYEDSDMGFRFCIDNCLIEYEKRDLEADEKENIQAMLGMCYNYYSKFLYKTSKYVTALTMASKSIENARTLYEKNHPNIINLLNDQAVIYLALKDFKSASAKFQEAIDICLENPRDELMLILPTIYANIGHLYIEIGEPDKAEEMCLNSKKYWLNRVEKDGYQNQELATHVKDCFIKLAGYKSVQRED